MIIKNIRKIDIFYYSIILFVLDYILHLVFNDANYNLFHILFFDIAIGSLLSFLLYISRGIIKKILYFLVNIIVLLYSFLVVIEIFIKINYDSSYPIKTITSNISNVLLQYNDEILDIVKNQFHLIIIFILFIVLFFILSKIVFLTNDYTIKLQKTIIFALTIIVSGILTLLTANKNINNWSDNLVYNGIKTAIIYDLKTDNEYSFDFVDIDIDNNVEIITTEDTTQTNDEIESIDKKISEEINEYEFLKSQELDEYNVLDYNFEELNKTETRPDFLRTNNYLSTIKPTKKNKYTGLFKNKNLIMICAEAWNSNIVNKELFPTIYRLINNGFKLNSFYQPHSSSSTSSGEYCFMTGMISVEDDYSFRDSIENNMGFSISSKLHDIGYATYSIHNGVSTYYGRDETHGELLNFDEFLANDTGLFHLLHKQWPDDKEMFDATFEVLPKDKPFMAYYMTYTAHMPYEGKESKQYKYYKDKIDAVYGDTKSIVYKNYVAKNMVLEDALSNLISNLEKNNMLNDTVICMVPDHYPYGLYRSNQFTHTKDNYVAELYNDKNIDDDKIKRDKTDIVLFCGSLENEDKDMVMEINKPTCTIDLTPTLLNLFGVEFDSRIYPGHDIFSSSEGIVIYQDGRFLVDGYACQNSYEDVPSQYMAYKNKVINANNYCKFNIKNDYYGYLVGKTGDIKKICYLMFEGGPTDNTLKILDILEKAKVNATFFISENQKLEYIKTIAKKDHKIGISLDNIELLINNENEKFAQKIGSIFSKVLDITKDKAYYVHYSKEVKDKLEKDQNIFLNQSIDSQLQKFSLKVVEENVDSKDLTAPITRDEIVNNVLSNVDGKEHIFVLLHDYDNTGITVDALPVIIDGLKNKGYRFKYMDQITKLIE